MSEGPRMAPPKVERPSRCLAGQVLLLRRTHLHRGWGAAHWEGTRRAPTLGDGRCSACSRRCAAPRPDSPPRALHVLAALDRTLNHLVGDEDLVQEVTAVLDGDACGP